MNAYNNEFDPETDQAQVSYASLWLAQISTINSEAKAKGLSLVFAEPDQRMQIRRISENGLVSKIVIGSTQTNVHQFNHD